MPSCRVTITYGPTGYSQNYKRHAPAHDHGAPQRFTRDALADPLVRVNAQMPPNGRIGQNQLGIANQADQMDAEPGPNWRAI